MYSMNILLDYVNLPSHGGDGERRIEGNRFYEVVPLPISNCLDGRGNDPHC